VLRTSAAIALEAKPPDPDFHAGSGEYAWRWRDVLEQRHWRGRLMASLPVRPRREFWRQAHSFWRAHGVDRPDGERRARDTVLGLHLRGTDRACAVEVSPQ
jgi:hypothetical protein